VRGERPVNSVALPRVGLIVPPDNHVAEVEAHTDLGAACTVHVARFPPVRERPMRDRLAAYNSRIAECADTLTGLAPAAVLVACTGSSYLLGPDREDAMYAQVSADLGHQIRGICRCIRDRLTDLSARSVILVSPYEPWLTQLSVQYWQAAGIEVVNAHSVGDGRHPYLITEEEVCAVLADLHETADVPVLVTGTGVGTLRAVYSARHFMSVPVLSSMRCGLDWLHSVVRAAAHEPEQAVPG
jgi:maleate isomerase